MPSARLNRGIVEPDKHRTAVLCILDSLLPPARRVILSDGGAGRVVEIGSGYDLRYTGEILSRLIDGCRHLTLWAVDPQLALDQPNNPVVRLRQRYPTVDLRPAPQTWAEWYATEGRREPAKTCNLAIAIQSTSLLPNAAFELLHRELAAVLTPGAVLLDVSEYMDRVTDQRQYGGLRLYPRSRAQRIAAAEAAGFRFWQEVVEPAHNTTPEDGCEMGGLAFRLES